MKMSCNGCRVLRKGCSETCSIRPCLHWIKTPQAQANATLFLAKFYGRAGLINLINSGPDHLHPAILRSLLYEACGRIVNPISGSTGLLWSGYWHLCQAAVEAVFRGAPITTMSTDTFVSPEACDIRHIHKSPNDEHRMVRARTRTRTRTRTRFKRSTPVQSPVRFNEPDSISGLVAEENVGPTGEWSDVSHGEPAVRLELGLGTEPAGLQVGTEPAGPEVGPAVRPDLWRFEGRERGSDTCHMDLRLRCDVAIV